MTPQPRSDDGSARFRAAYDPLTLVEAIIPAVARAAAGPERDPRCVSTRAYDRARDGAGFGASPSAQACARRVEMRWGDLLTLVFSEDRDKFRSLGIATRRDQRPQMPPELVARALRSVAELHGVTEVTPAVYDTLRDELVARDRRAWLHGGSLDVTLPTSDQIRQACLTPQDPEGWNSALSLAGFAMPKIVRGSIPVDVALEWFLQDAGWLPRSRDTLLLYSQARGFALAYNRHDTKLIEPLRTLRQRRDDQGLWTPQPLPVGQPRPRFEAEVMERAGRAAHVKYATYEQVLDAMLRAILATDRRLTQDAYQAWASRRPGAPGLHLVQKIAAERGKTFAGARSDALALRAAGVQPAARETTLIVDPDRVGEKLIMIKVPRPRLRGAVGRPRKYKTPEECRDRINARRRAARAARAQGVDPPPHKRRASRYASPDQEREAANARRRAVKGATPDAADGGRRQFRRGGKRIAWDDLIEAGIVEPDAVLHATRAGQRFVCSYNGKAFDVEGFGEARSLTAAAMLVLGGPQDGWSFWRIGTDAGRPVFKLRAQLIDRLAAEPV